MERIHYALARWIPVAFVAGVFVVWGFQRWKVDRGAGPADSGADLPSRPPAVVIDPGHGGIDGGSVGESLLEKDGALAISRRVAALLEEREVPVQLTRESDETVPLKQRSAIANREPRRLFVSIHLNAGPPGAAGIETFYSSPKGLAATRAESRALVGDRPLKVIDTRGELLAGFVQESASRSTGARDRGTKNRPGLSVTRLTQCPAVLIECGFLSDPEEAARLADRGYQERLADGIAGGIIQFLDAVAGDPFFGLVFEDLSQAGNAETVARR